MLVVAAPLEELLGQVWSARVQRGAPVSWVRFIGRWDRAAGLPPAADLPASAARAARRVGAGRVHVVVDHGAHDSDDGAKVIGRAPELRPLTAAAVDLLRRVNQVLAVRVPEDRQAVLRARLAASLPMQPVQPDELRRHGPGMPGMPDGPGLAVPSAHRGWLAAQSARVVEELTAGGYPVHGDLDRVVVPRKGLRHPGRPDRPRPAQVLDLLLDSVLTIADPAAGEGGPR